MKKLHLTQQQLLELLEDTITDPLTIRDLQIKLGVSSPSVIHHHIQQLEKKGYLRRNPYNTQDYQILANSPDKKIAFIASEACFPDGRGALGLNLTPVPT